MNKKQSNAAFSALCEIAKSVITAMDKADGSMREQLAPRFAAFYKTVEAANRDRKRIIEQMVIPALPARHGEALAASAKLPHGASKAEKERRATDKVYAAHVKAIHEARDAALATAGVYFVRIRDTAFAAQVEKARGAKRRSDTPSNRARELLARCIKTIQEAKELDFADAPSIIVALQVQAERMTNKIGKKKPATK